MNDVPLATCCGFRRSDSVAVVVMAVHTYNHNMHVMCSVSGLCVEVMMIRSRAGNKLQISIIVFMFHPHTLGSWKICATDSNEEFQDMIASGINDHFLVFLSAFLPLRPLRPLPVVDPDDGCALEGAEDELAGGEDALAPALPSK